MRDSSLELLWLSGLWEGEGSFYWRKDGQGYPRCSIAMTDLDVMLHAAAIINQWLPPSPKRHLGRGRFEQLIVPLVNANAGRVTPIYQMTLGQRRTLLLMALLRPFMHDRRRAKIDELFERWSNRA